MGQGKRQLGGQPALDAFEHELDELPIEPGVDPAFDLRGVDDDAGFLRRSGGAQEGRGEDQLQHAYSLRTKTTVGSTG